MTKSYFTINNSFLEFLTANVKTVAALVLSFTFVYLVYKLVINLYKAKKEAKRNNTSVTKEDFDFGFLAIEVSLFAAMIAVMAFAAVTPCYFDTETILVPVDVSQTSEFITLNDDVDAFNYLSKNKVSFGMTVSDFNSVEISPESLTEEPFVLTIENSGTIKFIVFDGNSEDSRQKAIELAGDGNITFRPYNMAD